MALEDDHHHCKVCGRVVEASKEVCSESCRVKRERTRSSARQLKFAMYVAALVLVLALLFSYFR